MNTLLICLGIFFCIVCSAFFSAAEMCFSSCNTLRLQNAKDDGDRRAAKALRVLENYDDALSSILIGNNLANISASSLASLLIIALLGSGYTWISTLGITVLVIIFGETIPKITAKKSANRLSLRFAPIIRILSILLLPLVRLTVFLIHLILSGVKEEESDDPEEAVEELQSIIETAEDEAVLDGDQTELIQAAIDFSDISAAEVMTARVDIFSLNIDDSWEDLCEKLDASPFSRIPVYEESVDKIVGILSLNRFLKARTEEKMLDLRSLLMPPCFLYKTTKLPDVLKELKKTRQHLAIVTDEYGGTLGLVTMEDVLEELVGDIWDENDTVEEEVIPRPGGEYELDGDMDIPDFLELLELSDEDFDFESETVGGWVLESFGYFPKSGESFDFLDWKVTALAVDEHRVDKVLIQKNK